MNPQAVFIVIGEEYSIIQLLTCNKSTATLAEYGL